MKQLIHFLCFLSIAGIFFSCSKETLSTNEPYSNTILSGNAAPSDTIGHAGDFYINLSNTDLYGPKTDSAGWGDPIRLKGLSGTNGTNGIDGNTILSGNGAPTASLGKNGDFYIDKTNAHLYGPKANNNWGASINLKGDPGTANVIYSDWVNAVNFRDTIIDNSELKIADVKTPQITSGILNTGTVLVYFTFNGTALPLPYTAYAGNKTNTMSFIPTVGKLIITRFTLDNSASVILSKTLLYRYIIIPGGVHTTGNINFNDYNAVKKAFHLND